MSVRDFGDGLTWRKARRSDSQGGDCVYVAADGRTGLVGVRDSKQGTTGAPLWYTRAEWAAFLGDARAGAFDAV